MEREKMMYFSGAKFEEHCSNISGDIPDIITLLICIMQKHEYL